MKNTAKFLHGIIIVVTLFLISCGNKQDFAYSEKITHDFYSCKERLDERHEELLDGKYDIDKSDQMWFDMEIKSVNTFKDFVSETKTTVNELNHSEVANKLHANTISYMSKIADEYAPLLIDYVNEQDSVKKLEIMQKLKTKKFELETLENKCLESQIEFLNKAGIKINPNQ